MRLIDADVLKEYINKSIFDADDKEWYLTILDTAPSIDIVRCKECKYWEDFECQCDWAPTDHEGGASYSLDRDADDFCSYGERRE